MSKFRVGQRVRIKWSIGWPELAGQVGTIVDVSPNRPVIDNPSSEWLVAPDCWVSSKAPRAASDGRGVFGPCSDQLEPATDCYDKTEWDACVWKPEHLRVGA